MHSTEHPSIGHRPAHGLVRVGTDRYFDTPPTPTGDADRRNPARVDKRRATPAAADS